MTGVWVIWREWTSGKHPGAAHRHPGVAGSRPGVGGVAPLVARTLSFVLIFSFNFNFLFT